jgi:hypothetical protein
VTVVPAPRNSSIRECVADLGIPVNPRRLLGLIAFGATTLAVVLVAGLGTGGGAPRVEHARSHTVNAAQPAAVYRDPPRCAKPHHARMRRSELEGAAWCERLQEHPNSSVQYFVGAP